MIVCKKKGCSVNEHNETKENKLELHHTIPKCMGGTDKISRVYLCKKHHDILGHLNLKWLWDIRYQHQEHVHDYFIKGTEKWLSYDS